MLLTILQATREALGAGTTVADWEFWGVAPDSENPAVGSVWPTSVTPADMGRVGYGLFCTAALWAPSPATLETQIDGFVGSLLSTLSGQGCPPALNAIGATAVLGELEIGIPSTSAASSTGNLRGLWSSVSFTLSITG